MSTGEEYEDVDELIKEINNTRQNVGTNWDGKFDPVTQDYRPYESSDIPNQYRIWPIEEE